MPPWPSTVRIALAVFCLVLLPSAGSAVSVQPGIYPEQFLSDPTPLYIWNVPLKVIILGIVSGVDTTAFFMLMQAILSLPLWLRLGHKKILKANVLENEARRKIYVCIRENSGVHLHTLSSRLELNIGTLRYHLGVLCEMKMVIPEHGCGFTRYRVNKNVPGQAYPDLEKKVNGYLCGPAKKRLLTLILQNPGINRKEIASRLELSGSGVAWHMKTLILEGIVRCDRRGKHVEYSLSSDAKEYLRTSDLSGDTSAGP
ncbi:MAG: winged helix-turn-helix transcriptional regulator [Methanoculleus sp.]|nr:winged helix-turn-helix transcriptional regulator [Methanoculleus sp.]